MAMGRESFEGPNEIGLCGHAEGAAGGNDAEQDAGAVGTSVLPAKSMLRRSLATFWNSRSVSELSMGTSGSSTNRKSAVL